MSTIMSGLVLNFALLFVLALAVSAKVSELTLLTEAAEKQGAVCLDGSPPGYYFRKGTANNWIIFLEGGGWCYHHDDCYDRSNTDLGSSTNWPKSAYYESGVLSDKKDINPDLYEWNSVFVPYCDGVSFAGDRTDSVTVYGKKLYFRGFRIFTAVIDTLLELGLKDADNAVLSGCSGGGLSVFYLLDYMRSKIPSKVVVKGLADAGYFINAPNINGKNTQNQQYEQAYKLHNTTSGVNQKCVKDHPGNESYHCLLAPVTYPYISTPLFSFNSQYDTWQLDNILQVNCMPPNCNEKQMKAIQHFREEFLKSAEPLIQSKRDGVFFDSCLIHCQARDDHYWSTVLVGNESVSQTFGNWFYQRSNKTKEVDCAYPCNETC